MGKYERLVKETARTMGESARAGARVVYDKDSQQIFIAQGMKSAFEEGLRKYSLASDQKRQLRHGWSFLTPLRK